MKTNTGHRNMSGTTGTDYHVDAILKQWRDKLVIFQFV